MWRETEKEQVNRGEEINKWGDTLRETDKGVRSGDDRTAAG